MDDIARSLGIAAEEPLSFSRFPRPPSKIAENVTVITADDIARINAHTLADVLQTVPGVQLDEVTTPGTFSFFNVLGTTTRHVQLLIDGVPQNFISADNIADPGSIPVQMIDRVEIIKGAASAAWGSALGGVINVFTKSPSRERAVGGIASVSLGEKSTTDSRLELSGTVKRFGYYVTGGKIHSQGLIPGNGTTLNHAFGKVSYDLPCRGNITLGLDVRENSPGQGVVAPEDLFGIGSYGTGTIDNLGASLTFSYPLADRLSLEIQGAGGRRLITAKQGTVAPPVLRNDSSGRELFERGKAALTWGDSARNLSAGLEYEHVDIVQSELVRKDPAYNFTATFDRWAAYLNGTYTVGRLSVLPGVRYDHMNTLQDPFSATVGATVRLSDSTIIRAYGARGYSLPAINNVQIVNGSRRLQQVWTVQAGMESAAIPFLWLKGTYFYNNISNIQAFNGPTGSMTVTLREQVRQGIDAELRTSPVCGVALTAAYTYSDARDKETDAEITGDTGPREGAKLGVLYENSATGTRAALTGNYAYWHLLPMEGFDSKMSSVIWDMHLTQRLFPNRALSPELFLSLHNIFNDDQYQINLRPNTPRWIEGGMRYRF